MPDSITREQYWVKKCIEIIMKIRKEMEEIALERKKVATSLEAQENKINHIRNGITVMKLIASAQSNQGIVKNPPTSWTAEYETFSAAIMKHSSIRLDITVINLLFQHKGDSWELAWDSIPIDMKQVIMDTCILILPKWENIYVRMTEIMSKSKYSLQTLDDDMKIRVMKLKQYQYYATKAFNLHKEGFQDCKVELKQHITPSSFKFWQKHKGFI